MSWQDNLLDLLWTTSLQLYNGLTTEYEVCSCRITYTWTSKDNKGVILRVMFKYHITKENTYVKFQRGNIADNWQLTMDDFCIQQSLMEEVYSASSLVKQQSTLKTDVNSFYQLTRDTVNCTLNENSNCSICTAHLSCGRQRAHHKSQESVSQCR